MSGTTGAIIGAGFGCAVFIIALGIVHIWRALQDWTDKRKDK